MNFYGSELWYNARDNADKLAITIMPSSIDSFTKLLEDNDLCYYGFDNGQIGKISVNRSDLELIKSLVGDRFADVMRAEEIQKKYTPPEKNIFGTIEYKFIAKKSRVFLTGESEAEQKALLRTAELLKQHDIKFSGRVYDDKVTITLNEQDLQQATDIYEGVLSHINRSSADIDKNRKLEKIEKIIEKMIDLGFSHDRLEQQDFTTVVNDLAEFDNIILDDYVLNFNSRYTLEQNLLILEKLKEIYSNGGFDMLSPSKPELELFDLQKEFKADLLLRNYFSEHSFTDEQKTALRDISKLSENMPSAMEHIDESFSPAEIYKLHELFENKQTEPSQKIKEIEQFLANQKNGSTGIGYNNSFRDQGNGTVIWMHHKGESFNIRTVTYKEILLAKSLFDSSEDIFNYISQTANSYETKLLSSDAISSYRQNFKDGMLYSEGDSSFFDNIAEKYSKDIEIVTLDDIAAFIAEDVNNDISEEQLRQLIAGKTDELMSHGGVDARLSGFSRSDIILLCSELRASPFSEKINNNLTDKVKSELSHKGIEVTEKSNDTINADDYTTEQFVEFTKSILDKQKEMTRLVSSEDFERATEVSRELSQLMERVAEIKAAIQKTEITQDDVAALRDIEPKRKAIPNMLETEVAQTPKFEKLLGEELGEKSPYEMRNGNLSWREDSSSEVEVITLPQQKLPTNFSELRKATDIERGTFVNLDTGMKVIFSKKSVNEIVAKAIQDNKRGVPVDTRVGAMYHMKDLVAHSVCFDSQISDYNVINSKNKSPNTLFMHQMYNIVRYNEQFYLVRISVEETYSTDKNNKFNQTLNRVYNLKDMKITPVEANRVCDPAVPDKIVGEDTSTDVVKVTIPQLYNIVKEYDKNFYENEQALGRAEREAEIEAQQMFEQSVKKLDEHNASLERDNSTSVPMEQKSEKSVVSDNVFDGMEQLLQNRCDELARFEAESAEARQIADTPFPKDWELSEKIERRDTLKAALQAEQAMNARKGNEKQHTFHFSVANLKRNQKKVSQGNQSVENGKNNVEID